MLVIKVSLVETLLDEELMRMFVVEELAVPLPRLYMVKLTVALEPELPLVGLTDRFWITRSDFDDDIVKLLLLVSV